MYTKSLIFLLLFLLGTTALADRVGNVYAPQPVSCITAKFSQSGSKHWRDVTLQLTNHCPQPVNLQHATVKFNTPNTLRNVWGKFPGLAYPYINVGSQGNAKSILLAFPHGSKWWKPKTKLLVNSSIELCYGVVRAAYDPKSVRVYANYNPQKTGIIELHNNSAQPAPKVQAPFIEIIDKSSKKLIKKIKAPWQKMTVVTNLMPKTYKIQPEDLVMGATTYSGTAKPQEVTVTVNKRVKSTITYTKIVQKGKINIHTLRPKALAGYTHVPEITATNTKTGATHAAAGVWDKGSQIDQLVPGDIYKLTSAEILFNGELCTAKFTPTNLIANTTQVATSILSYVCKAVKTDPVAVTISGLKGVQSLSAIKVIFIPDNPYPAVEKTIPIKQGAGNATVNLVRGAIYNVSSRDISGYSVSFTPQPLTVSGSGQTETIVYKKSSPPVRRITFSPYKDVVINMDWNTNVIGTSVTGQRQPLVKVLTSQGNKTVTLAFATGNCRTPTWGGVSNKTLAVNNIPLLEQNNIDYIISTGGAMGTFNCSSVADMDNFLKPFASKNLVGLDFDIEGQADFNTLMKTAAALQSQWHQQGKKLFVSLTLATLATSGSTLNSVGQAALQAAKNSGLEFTVNLMVMNYGSSVNCERNAQGECDMGASAIFAAKEFSRMYKIPLTNIALTPMIGENDSANQVTTLSDVIKIAQFVKQKGLAGLHYWSLDRDTPCGSGGGRVSPTCNPTSKAPLEYNQAMLKALKTTK